VKNLVRPFFAAKTKSQMGIFAYDAEK